MKLSKILGILSLSALVAFYSCGNDKKEQNTEESIDSSEFYATQPFESGLYDASYYDISGENARKGHFDGRIYFALSPDMNAFYVFENGNRTKIDYTVVMKHPFERTDSGTFTTQDAKGNLVMISPDSIYSLKFKRGGEDIAIDFSPKARHTASALEIMEKINEIKQKNNK